MYKVQKVLNIVVVFLDTLTIMFRSQQISRRAWGMGGGDEAEENSSTPYHK